MCRHAESFGVRIFFSSCVCIKIKFLCVFNDNDVSMCNVLNIKGTVGGKLAC